MYWLRFIFSHSVFVSVCAGAMCVQTFLIMGAPVSWLCCWFVFFSTLASYNFYWLISKYAFSKSNSFNSFFRSQYSHFLLLLFAAAMGFYCWLQLPQSWLLAAIAACLNILYSLPLWPFKWVQQLPKPGFLKTMLLAFTWAFVVTLLPMYNNIVQDNAALLWLLATRFFFMLMLCSIFDIRDVVVDKLHGLKSLATMLGQPTLQKMMLVMFLLYIVAVFVMRTYVNNSQQFIALLVTGLAVGWVYQLSLRKQGYFFYYFIVDGLMLFSSLATIVAHWL
jgi:4-hydroxybenzoate polyprenyltransferase